MQNFVTSTIRTIVPYIIGGVVSWLATKGVHASDSTIAEATSVLTFIFGSLYYVLARWLESIEPKLGFFLGVPSKPTYDK